MSEVEANNVHLFYSRLYGVDKYITDSDINCPIVFLNNNELANSMIFEPSLVDIATTTVNTNSLPKKYYMYDRHAAFILSKPNVYYTKPPASSESANFAVNLWALQYATTALGFCMNTDNILTNKSITLQELAYYFKAGYSNYSEFTLVLPPNFSMTVTDTFSPVTTFVGPRKVSIRIRISMYTTISFNRFTATKFMSLTHKKILNYCKGIVETSTTSPLFNSNLKGTIYDPLVSGNSCDSLFREHCSITENSITSECSCVNVSPDYKPLCNDGICKNASSGVYVPSIYKSLSCDNSTINTINKTYSPVTGASICQTYGPYTPNINFRYIDITLTVWPRKTCIISSIIGEISVYPLNFNGTVSNTPLAVLTTASTSDSSSLPTKVLARTDVVYIIYIVANSHSGGRVGWCAGSVYFYNDGEIYNIYDYLTTNDCRAIPNTTSTFGTPNISTVTEISTTIITNPVIEIPLNRNPLPTDYLLNSHLSDLEMRYTTSWVKYKLINNASYDVALWRFTRGTNNILEQFSLTSTFLIIPKNTTIETISVYGRILHICNMNGNILRKIIINTPGRDVPKPSSSNIIYTNIEVCNNSIPNIINTDPGISNYTLGASSCSTTQKYIANNNARNISMAFAQTSSAPHYQIARNDEEGNRLIIPYRTTSNLDIERLYYFRTDWLLTLISNGKCIASTSVSTSAANSFSTKTSVWTLFGAGYTPPNTVGSYYSGVNSCNSLYYTGLYDIDATGTSYTGKIMLYNYGSYPVYVANQTMKFVINANTMMESTLKPIDVVKLYSHRNECLGYITWQNAIYDTNRKWYYYNVTNRFDDRPLDIPGINVGKNGCAFGHISASKLLDTQFRFPSAVQNSTLIYNNTRRTFTISYLSDDSPGQTDMQIGGLVCPGCFWNSQNLLNSRHVYMIKEYIYDLSSSNTNDKNPCVADFRITPGMQVNITDLINTTAANSIISTIADYTAELANPTKNMINATTPIGTNALPNSSSPNPISYIGGPYHVDTTASSGTITKTSRNTANAPVEIYNPIDSNIVDRNVYSFKYGLSLVPFWSNNTILTSYPAPVFTTNKLNGATIALNLPVNSNGVSTQTTIINDINTPIVVYRIGVTDANRASSAITPYNTSNQNIKEYKIKEIMPGASWTLGSYSDATYPDLYTSLHVFSIRLKYATGTNPQLVARFINVANSTIRLSSFVPSLVSSLSSYNLLCTSKDYSGKYSTPTEYNLGAYLRNDTKAVFTIKQVIVEPNYVKTSNSLAYQAINDLTLVPISEIRDSGDVFPNKFWFPTRAISNNYYKIYNTDNGLCVSGFILTRTSDGSPIVRLLSELSSLPVASILDYVTGSGGCSIIQSSGQYDVPQSVKGQLINDTALPINVYYLNENGLPI